MVSPLSSTEPAWLTEGSFSLVHPGTGQLLSTTERLLSQHTGLEGLEGLEVMEVAGSAGSPGGQATTWRVLAYRGPALVEQLEEESQEELYGLGTTDLTTTARSKVNNTQSSTADLRYRVVHLDVAGAGASTLMPWFFMA